MDRRKAIGMDKAERDDDGLQLFQSVYLNSDVRKFGHEIPCGQPTKPTQTAREQHPSSRSFCRSIRLQPRACEPVLALQYLLGDLLP